MRSIFCKFPFRLRPTLWLVLMVAAVSVAVSLALCRPFPGHAQVVLTNQQLAAITGAEEMLMRSHDEMPLYLPVIEK